MPATIATTLLPVAAGRVGKIDEDKLIEGIRRLLTECFGAPFSQWVAYLKTPREEA